MKKILRVLSVFIIFCSILANLNVANALEPAGIEDKQTDNTEEKNILTDNDRTLPEDNEDNHSEDIIYRMDEDGNIYEATDLDLPGLVEEDEDFIQPYSIQEQVAVVNFNRGINAVTNYTEAGTGRAGYTHGQFGADAAYLEHSADGTLVKFMLSDVVGWVSASLVQIVRYDNPNARTLSYYTVNSNGRIVHNISTNINSSSHGTALTVGLASAAPYLRTGVRYYSYDGHYFYDNSDGNGYSRMITDYRNGVRTNSVNPNNPYYNYFQYLPHRSTTNYTAAELNRYLVSRIPNDPQSKMVNTGESFIRSQNTHGVNALLMYGVAINESNWGRSNIAQTRNNLFGHAAIDSNPGGNATGYATVADSIEHHANGFLSRGYLNANDWRYGGGHVGSKGSGVNIQYASDPYWGVKAASQAWVLDLTLGPKDAYKYTLGIKDTINTNHTLATVRNAASSSATGLYTTAAGTTTRAISNYPFILLDQAPQNGFYRIQSNTTLNANRTAINPTGIFNFDRDVVFMPTNNTTIVGVGNKPPEISNIRVSDVSSEGYTVTATITSDGGIREVLFPTWTVGNGQGDITWNPGTVNGNTYTYRVNVKDYNNAFGRYRTNIYAYGNDGQLTQAVVDIVDVPAPAPTISNIQITDVDNTGYTITSTIKSPVGIDTVVYPTWTVGMGQGDITWEQGTVNGDTYTYRVNASKYFNGFGKLRTEIHATGNDGQTTRAVVDIVDVPQFPAPVISNIKVSDIDSTGYTVTANVASEAGIEDVVFPTWTVGNGQGDITWESGTIEGNTVTYRVDTRRYYTTGNFRTEIHALGKDGQLTKATLDIIKRPIIEPPVISNIKISDIDSTGYTVTATVTSEAGIKEVVFPTWTVGNGQGDITWESGTIEGNTVTYRVDTRRYYTTGNFRTEVHAVGNDGQLTKAVLDIVERPGVAAPVISNIKVSDIDSTGYTVTANVTSEAGIKEVVFPTWTVGNGQGDITWESGTIEGNTVTYRVDTRRYYTTGNFRTEVHAVGNDGQLTKAVLDIVERPGVAAPVISNIKVSDIDTTGYTVTANVTSEAGIKEVVFPTWTVGNGQGDITWESGTIEGNTVTYRVDTRRYYTTGNFRTEVHAVGNDGQLTKAVLDIVERPEVAAPVISNIKVSDIDSTGYTVTATVTSEVGIKEVVFPTWTVGNGQGDITWESGTIEGNTVTYRVDASRYYPTGRFRTEIHAVGNDGQFTKAIVDIVEILSISANDGQLVNIRAMSI